MQDVWIKKIGERRGAPRLFLDVTQAIRAGFSPGESFEVAVDGQRVTLRKSPQGTHTVSKRVDKGGRELPVIDINSKELLAQFDGMDAIRVVVSPTGVHLLPLASEIKKRERLERLMHKMASGAPLTMGSLSHGGGILSHAIHTGLERAGIKASLAFANEIREDLIEHACQANDVWEDSPQGRTAAIVMPMQEAAQDDWLLSQLPKVEILEMGLPCSGASKAGVAKRGLGKMEDHPEVGHLVHSALVILHKVQPGILLLENVRDYATSASAQILRHQLRDMGYDLHEAILEGKDHGSLENRIRWCMVATTKGVDFDFEMLRPRVRIVQRVQDILDPSIGPDDARWRTFQGLKDKRERDEAKGSNFKMQVIHPEDTFVPTLRKGYHKAGSTDPLLVHPTDPNLLRLLTAAEHARAKGIPEHLTEGLSETIAHQLLGQGIVYLPFEDLGDHIGQELKRTYEAHAQRLDLPLLEGDTSTRLERMTG